MSFQLTSPMVSCYNNTYEFKQKWFIKFTIARGKHANTVKVLESNNKIEVVVKELNILEVYVNHLFKIVFNQLMLGFDSLLKVKLKKKFKSLTTLVATSLLIADYKVLSTVRACWFRFKPLNNTMDMVFVTTRKSGNYFIGFAWI